MRAQALVSSEAKCGDDGLKDTPVPMPNTEVKLQHAESSWGIAPCEDRTLPRGYSGIAQLVEHLTVNQVVVSSSLTAGVVEAVDWLVSSFSFYANLAQSVEHLPRKEKVGGSIPLVGTNIL